MAEPVVVGAQVFEWILVDEGDVGGVEAERELRRGCKEGVDLLLRLDGAGDVGW